MAITTWRPDTCDCVIDFEWDPAVPADTRVHVAHMRQACAVHAPAPGTRATADAAGVWAENQGKNRAIAAVLEHAPEVIADQISWRFDAERKLRLTVPGLVAGRVAALRAFLNARFADGRVTVE